MRKTLMLITALLIMLLLSACISGQSNNDSNTDLNIYSSVYPIQYVVERIGGETVNVSSVFPPGADAHTYEPTSKEMADIAKSDGFIYIGAGMEGFTENMAEALQSQDIALVALSEHEELFTTLHQHEEEHEEEHHSEHDGHSHGDYDPHIWLDPVRMIEMAHIIEDVLVGLNPEESELYQKNLAQLENDLTSLDQDFTITLKDKNNKKILVAHAAYGYWEERYGIEQIAINGISSSDEPSQKELTEIINQSEKNNLSYVIYEQNSNSRVSEIIQEQIGAKPLVIHNLSVLTETDIAEEKDYLSIMRENLEILDIATH